MSLSSTTNGVSYTGNGAVDTYAYTFKIFDQSHLLVTVKDTSDVETTLVIGTDYTVSGVGSSSGGNLALVSAAQAWLDGDGDLKSGYTLTIRRKMPLTQSTDIRNQGDYYPETIEDQLDKLVMIDQQQQTELDKSLKLSETTSLSNFDPTLPSDIADNPGVTIIVNDDGDGLALGPTAGDLTQASIDAASAAASASSATASKNAAAASQTAADASASAASSSASAAAQSAIDAAAAAAGVAGPASSVDNDIVLFSGTSGKVLKSGGQQLALARGGTNKSLTASAGAVVCSDSDSMELTAVGTAGEILQSNGTSNPSWVAKNLRSIVSKTTAYTLPLTDHFVTASASGGAFTITLPTVTSASGYEFTLIKSDSSTNIVTIDGNASETIQGALTRKLSTQYESLTIYSNGSEWLIKEHSYPSGWSTFTPTGSWSTNTTYLGRWRRVGDSMEINYQVSLTGAPTSASLTINLPSGYTIDTAKLTSTDTSQSLGFTTLLDTGTLNYIQSKVSYASSSAVAPHYNVAGTNDSQAITQSAPFTFASGDRVYARVVVPITNWEG